MKLDLSEGYAFICLQDFDGSREFFYTWPWQPEEIHCRRMMVDDIARRVRRRALRADVFSSARVTR